MPIFYTRLGRIFEDATLRSMELEANTKKFTPAGYKTGTIPDGVDNNAFSSNIDYFSNLKIYVKRRYEFMDAVFYEVKAAKNIKFVQEYNPDQFKKQIKSLTEYRETIIEEYQRYNRVAIYPGRAEPSKYGAAVLVLVTVEDAVIDQKLIDYATKNRVLLVQRKAYYDYENDVMQVSKGDYLNNVGVPGYERKEPYEIDNWFLDFIDTGRMKEVTINWNKK